MKTDNADEMRWPSLGKTKHEPTARPHYFTACCDCHLRGVASRQWIAARGQFCGCVGPGLDWLAAGHRGQEQGIQSVQLSGWAAPFGISLVADQLAATLIMLTGVVASMVVLFGFSDLTSGEENTAILFSSKHCSPVSAAHSWLATFSTYTCGLRSC